MRKPLALLLALLSLFLFSCGEKITPHNYCELSLPLPESYVEKEQEEKLFDAVYSDGRYIVAVLRVSFDAALPSGIPEALSPRAFASYYMNKTLGTTDYPIEKIGDVPYYEYESADGYAVLSTFYTSKYAYLAVHYIRPAEEKDETRDYFLGVATKATFLQ